LLPHTKTYIFKTCVDQPPAMDYSARDPYAQALTRDLIAVVSRR
jgi:hypothetical protein